MKLDERLFQTLKSGKSLLKCEDYIRVKEALGRVMSKPDATYAEISSALQEYNAMVNYIQTYIKTTKGRQEKLQEDSYGEVSVHYDEDHPDYSYGGSVETVITNQKQYDDAEEILHSIKKMNHLIEKHNHFKERLKQYFKK